MTKARRKQYKGFVIYVHPEFLPDYKRWHMAFDIERHHGSHIKTRRFSVPADEKTLFETEAEAIDQSFTAGAQVIDRGEGIEDL